MHWIAEKMSHNALNRERYQAAFDTSAKGIIAQGRAAFDNFTALCRYRDSTGCKCAIGQLIPDDKYDPIIETWGLPPVVEKGLVPGFDMDDINFLRDMQVAHDRATGSHPDTQFMQIFRGKMREVAHTYGLDDTVVREPADAAG